MMNQPPRAVMKNSALSTWAALLGAGLVISCWLPTAAPAEDWPQWRGPKRNGQSTETGWRAQWPAGGPKKLWDAFVGVGYSSVAVSQGRLFTMGNVQEKDFIYCLDAETGKPVWNFGYPCTAKDPQNYNGAYGDYYDQYPAIYEYYGY